jgi:hypothetical protein
MSTRLGQKFNKRAHVLGRKIESKGRVLGQKANEALRMADVGLRKTSNTLKNIVAPTSGLIGSAIGQPEIGAVGYGLGMGLSKGIDTLRNEIKPAKQVADRLEKLNLRTEARDLAANIANQLNEQQDFV